ncbi:thioredoxin family protein [soil metagenome]
MRIICFLLMTLAAFMSPAHAQGGAFGVGPANIAAVLQAESDTPAPGKPVTLAFVMTPRPGWHGYWENPGDAGIGMTANWDLPPGVKVGPLRYPVPQTLMISGLMNYVFEGRYAILVTLTVPETMKAGDRLAIRAKGQWLACTAQICVPGGGDMALNLVVGDGRIAPDRQAAFDGYRAHLPRAIGSEAHFTTQDGIFRVGIPIPAATPVGDPYFFALTEGAVKYASPQKVTRKGDLLIVETQAGDARPKVVDGVIRAGARSGFAVSAKAGTVPDAGGGMIVTVLLALGGAMLGGLLLNIMPCVFPILSLKALSLAKAGGDAGTVRREAVAYAVGLVVTCLALGGVLLGLRAGGTAAGWAFQLQDPRIILLLLVLVTAIALNLAGLFALRSVGVGGGLAGKGGMQGSFWTGVLVAFVATPCTGPFMGAALGAALVLPIGAALAIFGGLGLGLALPFLLIAFVPALRSRMPRPGAWMGRFQTIMSVPMFLTALALAWLLGRQTGATGMTVGIGAALVAGLLLWWLGVRQHAGKGGGLAFGVALLALFGGGVALLPPKGSAVAASAATGHVPFDEAKLAALRAQGKPVFLYFTADWCLTCKANEAAAIDRAAVTDAFAKAGVTVMVGDWTNNDPAIGRFLEGQGRSGVPLYLWYAPDKEAAVLPQVLSPSLLTGLASGKG